VVTDKIVFSTVLYTSSKYTHCLLREHMVYHVYPENKNNTKNIAASTNLPTAKGCTAELKGNEVEKELKRSWKLAYGNIFVNNMFAEDCYAKNHNCHTISNLNIRY